MAERKQLLVNGVGPTSFDRDRLDAMKALVERLNVTLTENKDEVLGLKHGDVLTLMDYEYPFGMSEDDMEDIVEVYRRAGWRIVNIRQKKDGFLGNMEISVDFIK